MKWRGECFIAIPGRYRPDQPMSLAIWFPDLPNGLFIFSRIVNADKAVTFLKLLGQSKEDDIEFIKSKSFLFFDKKLYPMALISIKNTNYPVYIFRKNSDITEDLVTLNYFIGQFYNYDYDEGMKTITFRLDGFTEALAAYNQYCNKNN